MFSDNYYATVLSATNNAAGNVVVRLLAHGSFEDVNDLHNPPAPASSPTTENSTRSG